MSALAAYLSKSGCSFAVQTAGGVEYLNFPYAYSKFIFSNQCNQGQFYKQVFKTVLKSIKKKISDFDIYIVTDLDIVELPFETKKIVSAKQVLDSISTYTPILMNNFSILSKDFSCSDIEHKNNNNDADSFCTNLGIYPQLVAADDSVQGSLDTKVINSCDVRLDTGKPLVFSGDRFLNNLYEDDLKYVTANSLIKDFGVYEIYFDTENALILKQLWVLFIKDANSTSVGDFKKIGTLVSSSDAVECLLTSDVGSKQFFEVPKNSLFTIPLLEDDISTLSIKGREFDNYEKRIRGGKVGLIVDTREYKKTYYEDVGFLNKAVKEFSHIESTLY